MLQFLNSLMEPLGAPAHHQQVPLSCWGERFTLALWEWQAPEENPHSLDHDTFSVLMSMALPRRWRIACEKPVLALEK